MLFNKLRTGSGFKVIVLGAAVFAVYLFSLCPTVYLIDSGELAAVSYTLGIAHPTGYPLYTLVSYFFAHLPGEPIWNLNVLAALFSVAASLLVYLIARHVLKNDFIPLLISSLYAFSPTIWRVSATNEVYPLTALFCVLIIFLLLKLDTTRLLYFLFFVFGLSFTNHIMIFSIVIPVLVYILVSYRPAFKRIATGFLFAALGVSLYLYLIARTQGGAELAWGNTVNLQRLFWHVTGRQYQVWMFSLSRGEIIGNAMQGLKFILRDFMYALFLFALMGFFWLFKNERKKFWLFLAIFMINFLYTINYAIPDIEPYYIPGLVSLLTVSIYGLRQISKNLKWFVVLPVAIIIPAVNFQECSLRGNAFGLDYGYAHISTLPAGSMLICCHWDVYSPIIYLRKVKKLRQDLVVIDKELLRRTWYIKYLEKEYPKIYEKVKKEFDEFLVELYKFEYNMPYDAYQIQSKYISMLESFVDAKMSEGVYFAVPVPDQDLNQVKKAYYRIPAGLCFRITRDTTFIPFDFSGLHIEKPQIINDARLEYNIGFIKRMAGNNVAYLNSIKRYAEARQAQEWLNKFLK